ncbi:MAG TPA: GNAT family N-acetyltransferase [Bacillota bacterium]|nr:GNAT family N-acetyltransferase [Bacillota bacterium]
MRQPWRRAGAADVEAVAALMEAFYDESHANWDRPAARFAMRRLLATPELGEIWVAPGDAGYIVLTFGYSLEFGGRDAMIDEFFVRPEARGQGLGRAGLDQVVDWCRAEGVTAIHLEVESHNPDASRLYRRAGFADHDRHLMTRRVEDARPASEN